MIDDSVNKLSTPEQEITDIQLSYAEKRKFRINGDMNKILELNVSDLNIFQRVSEAYPILQKLADEAEKKLGELAVSEDITIEEIEAIGATLTSIDKDMREQIDYIFDCNASEVCAPSGNMYDPVGGSLRFMHIVDTLSALYTNGLSAEVNKIKNNVDKRTVKYTNKRKRK